MIRILRKDPFHGTQDEMLRDLDPSLVLEDIIRGRFQRSPYLPLRHIKCFMRDGVLSLSGRVPTFYLKQLAQSIGASIDGVRLVSNELHVEFPEVLGDVYAAQGKRNAG